MKRAADYSAAVAALVRCTECDPPAVCFLSQTARRDICDLLLEAETARTCARRDKCARACRALLDALLELHAARYPHRRGPK